MTLVVNAILGIAIHGRESLPRSFAPFEKAPAPTLETFVKFDEPARSTFISGEAARYVAGESARIAPLEVREDGMLFFGFRVDWADELRGWWAGVQSRADLGPVASHSLLRLSDAAGEWIHADDPGRPPDLERARWLTVADVAGDRRLRGGGSTREDTLLLARASAALPDAPGVHRRYARALEAERRFEEALSVLDGVAPALDDRAACDRARVLLGLGRPDEALDALRAVALEHHPSPALSAHVRGLALRALQRHEEAVASFRDASSGRDCRYPSEAYFFGLPLSAVEQEVETLHQLGRFEEAIARLGPLLSGRARRLHGQCLEGLERWDDALAQYEKARDIGDPSAVSAILDLGRKRSLLARPRTSPKDGAIDVGWTVAHAKLGTGTVLDVEDGATTRVLVVFENGSEKWLPTGQVRVLTRAPSDGAR